MKLIVSQLTLDVNEYEKQKREQEEDLKEHKGMEFASWEHENERGIWIPFSPAAQKLLEDVFEEKKLQEVVCDVLPLVFI